MLNNGADNSDLLSLKETYPNTMKSNTTNNKTFFFFSFNTILKVEIYLLYFHLQFCARSNI